MTLDSFLEQRTYIPKTLIGGLVIWMLAGAGIKPGEPLDLPEPIPIEQLSPLPTSKPTEVWNPQDIVVNGLPDIVNKQIDVFEAQYSEGRFLRDFETRKERLQPYMHFFHEAADKYSLPVNYLIGKAMVESAGNPNAKSNKNARGLMQILPNTARGNNCREYETPQGSIDCAARIIRKVADWYARDTGEHPNSKVNLHNVSAGYLAGFSRVRTLIKKDSRHIFSEGVRRYITKIFAFQRLLEKGF